MATSFFMLGLVFPLLSFPSLGCFSLMPGLLIRSSGNSRIESLSFPAFPIPPGPTDVSGGWCVGWGWREHIFCHSLWGFYLESHLFLSVLQLPFEMASILMSSHHMASEWCQWWLEPPSDLPSLKGVMTTNGFSLVVPWECRSNVTKVSDLSQTKARIWDSTQNPTTSPLVTEQMWAPSVDSGACPLWGQTMDSVGEKQPSWKEWHW